MTESSPVCINMENGCKLNKEEESLAVNQMVCRSMIGSLLYITASRPDIMQTIGLVARFQANPKESHMKNIKRILRYLKGMVDYRLWPYTKDEIFDLKSFSDAYWAGSIDDIKRKVGMLSSLKIGWCLGQEKNNPLSHYQPLKHNTYQ